MAEDDAIRSPEETAKRNHNTSCTMAAIMTFGLPVLFIALAMANPMVLLLACPIVLAAVPIGAIWGIVLMVKGPKKVVTSPPLDITD